MPHCILFNCQKVQSPPPPKHDNMSDINISTAQLETAENHCKHHLHPLDVIKILVLSLAPQNLINLSNYKPPPLRRTTPFQTSTFPLHCRIGNSEKKHPMHHLHHRNLREMDPTMSAFVESHIVESFIPFARREIPILDDWQLFHFQISWLQAGDNDNNTVVPEMFSTQIVQIWDRLDSMDRNNTYKTLKKVSTAFIYFILSPISRESFVGRNISRHSGLRTFVNKTAWSFCSLQKCHLGGKQATSSWISSQSDILGSITRKKCNMLMFIRCLNAVSHVNWRCYCWSILGRYAESESRARPITSWTRSRAIVRFGRMCVCSVCFNEC